MELLKDARTVDGPDGHLYVRVEDVIVRLEELADDIPPMATGAFVLLALAADLRRL